MSEVLPRGRHHHREVFSLIPLAKDEKKPADFSRFFRTGAQPLGTETFTHDESGYTNALLLVKHSFPARHFAKTIGDTVVHKIGLVARGFELGRFARVGAVAMAMTALTVPNLLARFDTGWVSHHGSSESGDGLVGRRGGVLRPNRSAC